MTGRKNPPANLEAARIEEELIQSILDASGEELREYFGNIGEDPNKIVIDVDATVQQAIANCGQEQLRRAKAELQAWRSKQSGPLFKLPEQRQSIVDHLRSASAGVPMMLAARKGKSLSASDEEGLADDHEEAERLERDAENE